ncbi:MAG TPA: hypothetical protein VN948_10420 [Terriglobales bacterium]|nr:hypothetical protein [Terriglobales bacterium]
MRLTHCLPRRTGFAVAAAVMFTAITMNAQIVISNETPVTTTFVVNKTDAIAKCSKAGCSAKSPMLTSIPVTCPAAIGATCTFHISLNTKVTVHLPCGGLDCLGSSGSVNSYQFLIDGAAPLPGPTGDHGDYIFGKYVASDTLFPSRQSYPASVVATVTNSSSRNHVVDVNLQCVDAQKYYGCGVVAHWSSMRVDVFEP